MNSLDSSIQTITGPPLFSIEYSEIGCEVAEDFWRYFMNTGTENLLNDSTSSETSNSDFEESCPSSPSNTFLSSPQHETIQSSVHPSSIKEEPFEDRHSSGEDFHEAQDFLFLSREDLLKLSSKELEDYAQTLAATRPLTVEEEKLLKRQRRLIKNRESAQLSRQRKKIYIEDLERQVSALTAENIHLSKKVSALSVNNHSLVEEVIQLQKVVKKNHVDSLEPKKKQTSEQNLTKAGLCLMLVLFSFGLFLNTPPASIGKRGPFLETIPSLQSTPNGVLAEPVFPKPELELELKAQELSSIENTPQKREREEEEGGHSKRRRVGSSDRKSSWKDQQNPGNSIISQDSYLTVYFPSDELDSEKENLPAFPCSNVEFTLFPIYVSHTNQDQKLQIQELEVD